MLYWFVQKSPSKLPINHLKYFFYSFEFVEILELSCIPHILSIRIDSFHVFLEYFFFQDFINLASTFIFKYAKKVTSKAAIVRIMIDLLCVFHIYDCENPLKIISLCLFSVHICTDSFWYSQ